MWEKYLWFLQIAGSVSSVLCVLYFLWTVGKNQFVSWVKIRREKERRLDAVLRSYFSVGETVGGRTDLGFFINNRIATLRHYSLVLLIAAVGCAVVALVGLDSSSVITAVGKLVLAVMFCVAISVSARAHALQEKYAMEFEELWYSHIAKRVVRNSRKANEVEGDSTG